MTTEKRISVEVIRCRHSGVISLYVNDYRVAGHKPILGKTLFEWSVSPDELKKAIAEESPK